MTKPIRLPGRPAKEAGPREMQPLRNAVKQCFADCADRPADRLRQTVDAAKTPEDLWMLRNIVFDLVAKRHSQSEATKRIRALPKAFSEWIKPSRRPRTR